MDLNKVVLDTNVVLYWLGGRIVEPIEADRYFISVITEIELLYYSSLSVEEESLIRNFLADVEIVGLEQDVKEIAIAFRKNYRLRLPDAIITATASHLNATLITNDIDLARVTEIEIQSISIM